ncbi:hypothetical protein [Colwellia sp. 75C3]|uniref:hypothetical protein n=1 Tax=Colwellia sp. 75C3 TaxID=888425 RepID=UPI0018E35659|nr:hypothetical protein [Colwellia sp. 75C3]
MDNDQKLSKLFKIFFPSLFIISVIFYQCYRYSIDTIEIYVVSKDSEWVEHCTEHGCVEALMFTIKSKDESFTTSEGIFNQLEPKNSYLVGSKGWSSFGTNRKLTQVY